MDFSGSDVTGVSFKGANINGAKFRKDNLSTETLREARSAIGVIEIAEDGTETPHPGSPKCIRKRNTALPNHVLQGKSGFTSKPISTLASDPPSIYIRSIGGWWARCSNTEHRPVVVVSKGTDWYETHDHAESFDPNETVKVIL
jgi:uncharacterized protein YjbI with pentapeptide repeats